jgi:hypothetical protein
MLEMRVKQLESLLVRHVPFVRKVAAEKEAPRGRWPRRRTMTMRKTRPGHREVATTTSPSAPSYFLESCVGSSFPFSSTICTSTRMVCSSTSKASSRMQCHCPTWSNNIAIFLGCSKQPCLTREDHELDV